MGPCEDSNIPTKFEPNSRWVCAQMVASPMPPYILLLTTYSRCHAIYFLYIYLLYTCYIYTYYVLTIYNYYILTIYTYQILTIYILLYMLTIYTYCLLTIYAYYILAINTYHIFTIHQHAILIIDVSAFCTVQQLNTHANEIQCMNTEVKT